VVLNLAALFHAYRMISYMLHGMHAINNATYTIDACYKYKVKLIYVRHVQIQKCHFES